ncbi:M15 family metallopeptidase [Aliikangiella maris]|uniref:M15 family metallopeptidase n=2 Tax=Aliikangiella maris TaxID=3162458 RepID=A0ABV3MP72_9GAMM
MHPSISWQNSIGIVENHLSEFIDITGVKYQINRQVHEDLQALLSAAKQAGIEIAVVSAYRSFSRQLQIWNNKWIGKSQLLDRNAQPLEFSQLDDEQKFKAICHWSAIPGLSRHHWGTDFDIFNAQAINKGYQVRLIPEEFGSLGPCTHLANWLDNNLENFQFFRPYRIYQQGVAAEPWHISHIQCSHQFRQYFNKKQYLNFIDTIKLEGKAIIQQQLDHYLCQYFDNICLPQP